MLRPKEKLLELLADCKLLTNRMSGFLLDGPSVVTGKRADVAARPKSPQYHLSFHCMS